MDGGAAALRGVVDDAIATIDALIASQLDAILHHPRVLQLEGSWRAARWLVDRVAGGRNVRVRMFNASWREIDYDLDTAVEFDQSDLWKKIYEADFGTAGGEPFGILVVDHLVRHRRSAEYEFDDIAVLERLAGIGAAAFAPVIIGASPALLDVRSFADLARVPDPAEPLADAMHANWRKLAERDDMRFLAVTLPRVLARPPWHSDGSRDDGFRYDEYAPDAGARVWMNAAYAFAAVAARAFADWGWPADVRAADTDRIGGGLVTDLPEEPFDLGGDHFFMRRAIEIVFFDAQEHALIEAGLMPLSALPFGEELVFDSVRSFNRPRKYVGPGGAAATADGRVAAQINAALCGARFAHHLKIMARSMIGRMRRAEDIEAGLQAWLTGFVNSNPDGTPETRAKAPLARASVRVYERPDQPGVFDCAMKLQPHFQLDNLAPSFDFTVSIDAPH